MASSSWELAMATSSTYQTAATYAQWQRDYAEHESRMQNPFRRKKPRTDDINTWTLDEIDEWANKCPRMRRWMQRTWWSPVPTVPIAKTDNLTSTVAYISIGDVTYRIMFCLECKMIARMRNTDKYWNSFGEYCIKDIGKYGHMWVPPENYF